MGTSAISPLEQKMASGSQVLDPGVILQMLYLTLMNKLDCTVMTYFYQHVVITCLLLKENGCEGICYWS